MEDHAQTVSEFLGEAPQRTSREFSVSSIKASSLSVDPPELRGTNKLNQYHAYKVNAPGLQVQGDVYRRYSEFVWLRTTFFKMWPGIFVPPLPPKALIKTNTKVLEERQQGLQNFLRHVSQSPYLTKTVIWKNFLCNTTSFDFFMKQTNKEMALIIDFEKDMLARYMKTPGFPSDEPLLSEGEEEQLIKLRVYFSEMTLKLEAITEAAENLVTASRNTCSELAQFNKQIGQVYSAERGDTVESQMEPQRIDVTDTFARVRMVQEPMADLADTCIAQTYRQELEHTRAIVEMFDSVAFVSSNLQKAKVAVKRWAQADNEAASNPVRKTSMFGSISRSFAAQFSDSSGKSDKEQRDEDTERLKVLGKVNTIASRVMLAQQLPALLTQQNDVYRRMVETMADQQKKMSKEAQSAWRDLMDAADEVEQEEAQRNR